MAIAVVCAALGAAIGGETHGGVGAVLLLALAGAVAGPWVAAHFHLRDPLVVPLGGYPFPIVSCLSGSALFVILMHFVASR